MIETQFTRLKLLCLLLLTLCGTGYGQHKKFKEVVIVESTGLKHQKYTGQCWSFASTSLLEAEAMRLNYDFPELSSFYFVYHNYLEKSRDYLTKKRKSKIFWGDLTFSVLEIFEKYGCVPEEIYDGALGNVSSKKEMMNRWKEEDKMNALLNSTLDSLIDYEADIDASLKTVDELLKKYIGEVPSNFEYKRQDYTPKTFAKRFCTLKAGNYIELTSYSHLPFYVHATLDIPGNWRDKNYVNIPLEGFIKTIYEALKNGYTLAWDGDIGEDGGFEDNGLATLKGEYEKEKLIGQEQRQSAFERKTTTDDHNMHIVGFGQDKQGLNFFILKNTWGKNRGKNGFWYLSENYFRLRTVSVTVNKQALPTDITSKLDW